MIAEAHTLEKKRLQKKILHLPSNPQENKKEL